MKSILDKSFRYVPAAKTDVRKTFARIRREQAAAAAEQAASQTNVKPITTNQRKAK